MVCNSPRPNKKSGHISVRFLFHYVQRCYNFLSRFVLIYPALSRLSCWMGGFFLKGFNEVTQRDREMQATYKAEQKALESA